MPKTKVKVQEDKRIRILEATMRLITENGFHATPMSLIAKEACVAAGTIYHYFDSKEELIAVLYAEQKEKMGEALHSENDENLGYKERFFLYWKNLYRFFRENPTVFSFLTQYANSPLISEQTREENYRFYKPAIDFMQEAVTAGVLRQMPIELMTAIVYGNISSAVQLALSGELEIDEKILNMAAEASWRAVRN